MDPVLTTASKELSAKGIWLALPSLISMMSESPTFAMFFRALVTMEEEASKPVTRRWTQSFGQLEKEISSEQR